MHAGAVFAIHRFEGAVVGMKARVFREKRRMDVEYPAGVAGDKLRRQDAHETRKHNELRSPRVERLAQRPFETLFIVRARPRDRESLDAEVSGGGNAGD